MKLFIKELKFFVYFVLGYIPFFFGVMFVIKEEPQSSYFFQGMIVAFIVTYVVKFIFMIMRNIK